MLLKLGDPKKPETDLGPLISQKQQERVLHYGGIPYDPALARGFFIEPTL